MKPTKAVDTMGSNRTVALCQIEVQVWDESDRCLHPTRITRKASFSCPDLCPELKPRRPILERTISAQEPAGETQAACLLWSSNCHAKVQAEAKIRMNLKPEVKDTCRLQAAINSCKILPKKVGDSSCVSSVEKEKPLCPIFLSQVMDLLYVGSVEAAYSESVLCRFGIDCIVDVSNRSPQQVPSGKKSIVPCRCPEQSRPHIRNRLCLLVAEDEAQALAHHVGEAIQFIRASRNTGRRVLVHCSNGTCRGPALVIAYLMHEEKMSLQMAYEHVVRVRPSVQLRPGFWDLLQRMEDETKAPSDLQKKKKTSKVHAWC